MISVDSMKRIIVFIGKKGDHLPFFFGVVTRIASSLLMSLM